MRYRLLFVLLSFVVSSVEASFDVFGEDSEGYYGSAQTRPFRDAVDNTDSLSQADRAFLDSVEETRITERWYIRAMVGKSKLNLNKMSNDSSSFLDTFVLSTTSVSDNLYQLTVAGGKIWEEWAFEMEFLFSKKLKYSLNPVLVGVSPVVGAYSTAADVELDQYILTANAQYIIPRMFSFYPRRLQVHLDAGAGIALLNTNVNGTANSAAVTPALESASAQSFPAVGMLGAGARYQISPHFLTGITYRYYGIGRSKYGPVQSIKWTANQLRTTGFFIDVTYQL